MLIAETVVWLVEVFIFNAAVFPNIKLDSDIKVLSPLDKGRGGGKENAMNAPVHLNLYKLSP